MAYIAKLGDEPWRRRNVVHPDDDLLAKDDVIEIGNEFALVRARKVYTRNGVRLEIASPKMGYSIRLDAVELESLTWQTPETFSRFLADPFGPHPG